MLPIIKAGFSLRAILMAVAASVILTAAPAGYGGWRLHEMKVAEQENREAKQEKDARTQKEQSDYAEAVHLEQELADLRRQKQTEKVVRIYEKAPAADCALPDNGQLHNRAIAEINASRARERAAAVR